MNRAADRLQIGRITCSNQLALAPMAGLTDSPFRQLCLEDQSFAALRMKKGKLGGV